MSHPPLLRFLGLQESASDQALLDIDPDVQLTNDCITDALGKRLAYLDRHPGGSGPAAATIRRRLGEAAGRLMASIDAPVPPPAFKPPDQEVASEQDARPDPPPRRRVPAHGAAEATKEAAGRPVRPGEGTISNLTEFDRTVLAILVGSGGWNGTSRARLIGLAARRGLKPKGLMRIVSGLAQLLQGGGFETIAGTKRAISVAAPIHHAPPKPTRIESTMNQVAAALASEFRAETSGSRMRVTIYFSVAAIFLIALFAVALSLPSPAARQAMEQQELDRALAEARTAAAASQPESGSGGSNAAIGGFGTALDQPGRTIDLVPQKLWAIAPNFRGDARPRSEILRAHDASDWIQPLETIARKSALPQAGENVALRREYASFIDDSGRCWPLMDPTIRTELLNALVQPIADSAAPQLREDMVDMIGEQLDRIQQPIDVWKSSWSAGLLGSIATGVMQPEGARAAASELLMVDLGQRRRSSVASERPFDTYAGRKLDSQARELVLLSDQAPEHAYQFWEYWLEAQKTIRRGASLDAAFLDAIDVVLRDSDALERSLTLCNVLGRLVAELDFSPRASDPELVRANIRSWFDDETIPSDHLWVLGSMLAQSVDVPWWDATFVVAPDASARERGWYADLVDSSWPQLSENERPRGIPVPSADLERVDLLIEALDAAPQPGSDAATMYRLLAWAHVVASIEALSFGEWERAKEQASLAEAVLNQPMELLMHPADFSDVIGRFTGNDGIWTEEWIRMRRNSDDREAAIRFLGQRKDGDLGPVDSATLASEAFRGTPRELRLQAQEAIIENFALGPNIAVALLDIFEFAPRNQDTAEFVMRLTGADLPALASDDWRESARAALVEHALALQESEMHDIDRFAANYRSILHDRLLLLGGDPYVLRRNAAEIASSIVDMVKEGAQQQFVSNPIPASFAELDRRRNVRLASADGEPQQLAAELAALVDIITYQTAGMRPDLRKPIDEFHSELTGSVAIAPGVLQQITLLERAAAKLMLMRLEPEGGSNS